MLDPRALLLKVTYMEFFAKHRTPRRSARWAALAAAVLVLLLELASTSPDLHAALHAEHSCGHSEHSDEPGQSHEPPSSSDDGHVCAVTFLQSGVLPMAAPEPDIRSGHFRLLPGNPVSTEPVPLRKSPYQSRAPPAESVV